MGRQFPEQSVKGQSRKAIVRFAEYHKEQSEQRLTILQNALVYNAGLHKTLQHELCACQHGASKHFSDGAACTLVDCECQGFVSNYTVNLDRWRKEVWDQLLKEHNIAAVVETDQAGDGPMSPAKLIEAFESGVKAEDHAKGVANWLSAKREESAKALAAAQLEQVVDNLNDGLKETPMEAEGGQPASDPAP